MLRGMSNTPSDLTLEYTMKFTEDELILLIQCLHKDMMGKQDQPEVEIEPGTFSHTPQHSALLQRMSNERHNTILKAKGLL